MFGVLGQKIRPIGLDIGHTAIKMIQCAVSSGRMSVIAAQKTSLPDGLDGDADQQHRITVSALREMVRKGGFRGSEVISCLPNDVVRVKSFRVDCGQQKIDDFLQTEVAGRFGLNPNADEVRHMIAGDVRQGDEVKSELILFAVDAESIRRHIALLEEAGLQPVGLDTVPCSLFRSFERSLRRQEDRDVVNVFVDLGGKFTTVVVGRGRELSFVKQIPLGSQKFDNELAAQLSVSAADAAMLRGKVTESADSTVVDPATRQMILETNRSVAEELAREISLCFRYYAVTFRGKRPGRAVFAGGGAYDEALLNELRNKVAIDVEVAEPLKGFDLSRVDFETGRGESLSEWAVAVGAGLKGWRTSEGEMEEYERN